MNISGTEGSIEQLSLVTRIELISDEGRQVSLKAASDVAVSIQDSGRTLKIFYTGGPHEPGMF